MKTAVIKIVLLAVVLFLSLGYVGNASTGKPTTLGDWNNMNELLRVHTFNLTVTKTADTIDFDPVDESAYNAFLDHILGTEENGNRVLDTCGDLRQGDGMCIIRIYIQSNGIPLIKSITFQEYR